jgi:hypothetical protein
MAGHLALAVFVTNGVRASSMQQTIAQIGGAAFEFFTGKPLPAPQRAKAIASIQRPRRSEPRTHR